MEFDGIEKVVLRVDLKWVFEVYAENEVMNAYRFLIGHVNDVTLAVFANVRTKVTAVQLIEINSKSMLCKQTLFCSNFLLMP